MSAYPGYSSYPSNAYNPQTYPGPDRGTGYPEKSRYDYNRGGYEKERGGYDRDRGYDRNYKSEKYDRYERGSMDRLDRGGGRSYGYPTSTQSYTYDNRGGPGLPPPVVGGGSVIMSQPRSTKFNGPMRDWSSGLCECSNDMKICCCVFCCSPFYECCIIEEEFGEHCCNVWLNQSTFLALRYKFRNEHNIEGSLLEDCMVSTFCGYCMMCQLLRENQEVKKAQFRVDRSLEARMQSRADDAYMQRY